MSCIGLLYFWLVPQKQWLLPIWETTNIKACLHRRAVTGSGNGKRYAARYCPFIHKGGNPFGMQISMLMTFHKYQVLGAVAPGPYNAMFVSLCRDLASQSVTSYPTRPLIGQNAQSQRGISEKSLRFLKPAVYRPTARFVRTQCKQSRRKPCVLYFLPRGIPLPLVCVNGPLGCVAQLVEYQYGKTEIVGLNPVFWFSQFGFVFLEVRTFMFEGLLHKSRLCYYRLIL